MQSPAQVGQAQASILQPFGDRANYLHASPRRLHPYSRGKKTLLIEPTLPFGLNIFSRDSHL